MLPFTTDIIHEPPPDYANENARLATSPRHQRPHGVHNRRNLSHSNAQSSGAWFTASLGSCCCQLDRVTMWGSAKASRGLFACRDSFGPFILMLLPCMAINLLCYCGISLDGSVQALGQHLWNDPMATFEAAFVAPTKQAAVICGVFAAFEILLIKIVPGETTCVVVRHRVRAVFALTVCTVALSSQLRSHHCHWPPPRVHQQRPPVLRHHRHHVPGVHLRVWSVRGLDRVRQHAADLLHPPSLRRPALRVLVCRPSAQACGVAPHR